MFIATISLVLFVMITSVSKNKCGSFSLDICWSHFEAVFVVLSQVAGVGGIKECRTAAVSTVSNLFSVLFLIQRLILTGCSPR